MRHLVPVLLLIASPFLAGCEVVVIAAVAGVGGYFAYSENEHSRDYLVEFDDAWEALGTSLDALDYPEERTLTTAATDSTVEVNDLWVKMERHPQGVVRLRVRIGTFVGKGHKRRSTVLFDMIEKELDVSPIVQREPTPEMATVGPHPAQE